MNQKIITIKLLNQSKMKQTAVDILYNFLYEMKSFEGFDPYSFNQEDVFKKAKEIQFQQMKKSYYTGLSSGLHDHFEKYYEDTYSTVNKNEGA